MSINEVQFSFKTLSGMDGGKLEKLLAYHINNMKRDCENRPNERKARKVLIEMSMIPVPDETGYCELVKMSLKARSRTPDFITKDYELRPNPNGLVFNADFPAEYKQPSLFDGEKKEDDTEE